MQLPNTRWSDRFFLVLAIAAALFAIFMHFGIAATQVSRKEWASPAHFVRKHFQPGDVIGIVPAWALKGAEALHDRPMLFAETLHKEDLSRYRRLWVLVAPRLGKWWFRRSFRSHIKSLKRRYWLRQHRTFGKIELYLFQLPRSRPLLFDFANKKHLRRAEVGLEIPARSTRVAGCAASVTGSVDWLKHWREHPGWHTGNRGYFFGRIIQEIDNTPRDCLWAQPQRCKVLRARYRNVPLTGELQIEHGFTTAAPGGIAPKVHPTGPDVVLSVWVENVKVKEFRVSQKQHWRKVWLDLSAFKFKHDKGSVEFTFKTPGLRARRTGYCFRAEIRKLPPQTAQPPRRR